MIEILYYNCTHSIRRNPSLYITANVAPQLRLGLLFGIRLLALHTRACPAEISVDGIAHPLISESRSSAVDWASEHKTPYYTASSIVP